MKITTNAKIYIIFVALSIVVGVWVASVEVASGIVIAFCSYGALSSIRDIVTGIHKIVTKKRTAKTPIPSP